VRRREGRDQLHLLPEDPNPGGPHLRLLADGGDREDRTRGVKAVCGAPLAGPGPPRLGTPADGLTPSMTVTTPRRPMATPPTTVRLDLTTTLAPTASATVWGIAPATPFSRRKVFRETRLATHADAACASATVRPRPGVPGKLDLSGRGGSFTKAPWASKNQTSAHLSLAEQGLWSVKASKVATWRRSGATRAHPLRPHGVVLVFIIRKSSPELFLGSEA